MISEKANVGMQAALHAIRPGEPALPADLVVGSDRDFRGDDLAELLGLSMVYARAGLRAAGRPVTALFSISEPRDAVVPVTTSVTFGVVDFADNNQPQMLLSTGPVEFLYACDDEQWRVMADTADALEDTGLSRDVAVAWVNEFWGDRNRRFSLLYGGWIGHQDGAGWARAILDRPEVITDG
ncbi:hypothetical protein LFM09_14665 [Lentzea alba]|uniref:hypothetical protein n=1 Tax=Lentzea alba TaxID=2714351 RepID=UPI0039BFDB0D